MWESQLITQVICYTERTMNLVESCVLLYLLQAVLLISQCRGSDNDKWMCAEGSLCAWLSAVVILREAGDLILHSPCVSCVDTFTLFQGWGVWWAELERGFISSVRSSSWPCGSPLVWHLLWTKSACRSRAASALFNLVISPSHSEFSEFTKIAPFPSC